MEIKRISQSGNPLNVTISRVNESLQISQIQVFYVNPWWTEFVTSDGTFTLADGKMFKVINN